ncbi:ferrochelatase [Pilibacter termitis]|uniref:Coproporphyrin III ferrochelatase n=1 Tax=Pilibacter termitis TaxID=263852 RepID=A0A1T4Q9T8_9ENTE|nr:ferrochelatase [Pilibacter termitis]SKA00523.1 ferrochelatase [Pilibacter termitis]
MEKGILLVNLGTPTAPTTKAVKAYLAEFLGDPLVIQKPRWWWLPLLHGIILQVRPKKSALLYQKIWTPNGSPLFYYTQKQAENLQEILPQTIVKFAMTYGKPSISDTLSEMKALGCTEIIVIPLYPQYSVTTTEPIIRQVEKTKFENIKIIHDFYQEKNYLSLLAKDIQKKWQQKNYDCLLLSYHGIPVEYVKNGDPYQMQCEETTAKLRELLPEIPQIFHAYQSKFGRDEWLSPATCDTLKKLPLQNKKRVLVAAPSFVCDCLETLEELGMENKGCFLDAGGIEYDYVSPFNDEKEFAFVLKTIVESV